ncbi:MAG: hypothetical protein ABW185_15355 [Sedimenticola sp.]
MIALDLRTRWLLFVSGVLLVCVAVANHFGIGETFPIIGITNYKLVGAAGIVLIVIGYSTTTESEKHQHSGMGDDTPGLCERKRDSFWGDGGDGGGSSE